MISVEEIDPENTAAPAEVEADAPEDGVAAHSASLPRADGVAAHGAPDIDGVAAHSADVPPPPDSAPPPVDGVGEAAHSAAAHSAQAAPKKRGRPKAAPKEKPAPKPKGRPRKVTVVEEEPEVLNEVVEPPPLTDNDLRDSLGPILRIYASHLMRGRQGKRARYRELFSQVEYK